MRWRLNRMQVVLEKTEHCYLLIQKVDEMVTEQMRRLGLSHLVTVPSVEMPHDEGEARLARAKDWQHQTMWRLKRTTWTMKRAKVLRAALVGHVLLGRQAQGSMFEERQPYIA